MARGLGYTEPMSKLNLRNGSQLAELRQVVSNDLC